jgi:hypothetical protein
MRHRNIAVLSLLAVLAALLAVPASASPLTAPICFSQVPDCIDGRFAEFWQQNGGLPVFGLPKSPASQQQVEGKTYLVQLFERNRFELHPENARPYDVLLGRLGDDLLKRQGRDWNTFPKVGGPPEPGCLFFGQTGHSICGSILRMYRANGLEFDGRGGKSEAESLALFGLPLSEPQVEDTPNGRFTVQWFERARFEVHPENSAPYDVLLGLLGNETAAAPAPAPAPPAPPGPAPLPPSVNAVARPERGPRGTTFVFAARGFQPGERIGVYITVPDQSVFGAPFQTTADDQGVSDSVVSFRSPNDPELPTGIWAITFEGVDSHNKAIAYFEITE